MSNDEVGLMKINVVFVYVGAGGCTLTWWRCRGAACVFMESWAFTGPGVSSTFFTAETS